MDFSVYIYFVVICKRSEICPSFAARAVRIMQWFPAWWDVPSVVYFNKECCHVKQANFTQLVLDFTSVVVGLRLKIYNTL